MIGHKIGIPVLIKILKNTKDKNNREKNKRTFKFYLSL